MENLSIELLPVAEEVPAFHPLPVVSHAFDPDRIADVLARITGVTQHPMIRTVFYCPVRQSDESHRIPDGIGWIASIRSQAPVLVDQGCGACLLPGQQGGAR